MLTLLYQDDDYVAIHKPAGLLVHRSNVDKYETEFAVQQLRDQINCTVYPVHRLDKPTSGVLLFALSPDAAAKAQELFAQQKIQKQYDAIVRGYAPTSCQIDHPVKAVMDKKYGKTSESQPKKGLTALATKQYYELPFSVDKRFQTSRYSWVSLSPKTGRKHQLRYHMKHIAHPIIGDVKYGKGEHNRFFEKQFYSSRLLLWAKKLSFIHPYTQQFIHIESNCDHAFNALIDQLQHFVTTP